MFNSIEKLESPIISQENSSCCYVFPRQGISDNLDSERLSFHQTYTSYFYNLLNPSEKVFNQASDAIRSFLENKPEGVNENVFNALKIFDRYGDSWDNKAEEIIPLAYSLTLEDFEKDSRFVYDKALPFISNVMSLDNNLVKTRVIRNFGKLFDPRIDINYSYGDVKPLIDKLVSNISLAILDEETHSEVRKECLVTLRKVLISENLPSDIFEKVFESLVNYSLHESRSEKEAIRNIQEVVGSLKNTNIKNKLEEILNIVGGLRLSDRDKRKVFKNIIAKEHPWIKRISVLNKLNI